MRYTESAMATNQGLTRFTRGYSRKLTNSEVARGYIFISMDKKITSNEQLRIDIDDQKFGCNDIDKSGRILGLKKVTAKINQNTISYHLTGNHLQITF